MPRRYFTPPFSIYPGLAPLTVLFGFAASGPSGAHDTPLHDVFYDQKHKIQFTIVPSQNHEFAIYTHGFLKNSVFDYERVTQPMIFFSALQILSVLHDENAPLQELYGHGRKPEHHPVNIAALRYFNTQGEIPGIVTTRTLLLPPELTMIGSPDFPAQATQHMAQWHNNKAGMMDYLDARGELDNLRFLFSDTVGPVTGFFALRHIDKKNENVDYALYAVSPLNLKRIGRTNDFDTACRTLGILESTYIMPNITARDDNRPVMHYTEWAEPHVLHDIAAHPQPRVA